MTGPAAAGAGPTYEQALRSWTGHLRSGGTRTWQEWVASGTGADAVVPVGWAPPGAAQLGLLHRVAVRDRLDVEDLAALADLVLGRSGPGRGLAQQPLAWAADRPGDSGRHFGAPPVDPADVPDREVLRVAVGTLTELLLLGGAARPSVAGTPPRRSFWRPGPAFRLCGAPVTTAAVRRALAAAGVVEGGRSPQVLVVAPPLDVALAQVWSARVQRGASVRWTGFVDRWASRPVRLPPSADFATLARQWAERVGGDRVHVLLADETATVTHRAAREVLCLAPDDRQPGGSALRPRWRDLAPAQSDLLRRVNSVLNVRVEDDTRAAARARLLSSLRDTGRPHDLTVPAAHRGWVADRARALADDLRAGGYPVHGDLDRLVPARGRRPGRPVVADVLASALDACLDLAAGNEQLRRAVRR